MSKGTDTQDVTESVTDTRWAVTITLKSGVQLRGECDEFKTQRSPVFGELRGLEWSNLSVKWPYIDLSEIAAIEAVEVPA